jgi:hypothetical protein
MLELPDDPSTAAGDEWRWITEAMAHHIGPAADPA